MDSHTPSHDPEVLRRDAPRSTVMGYQGRSIRMASAFADAGFIDVGDLSSGKILPHGPRGNIAQLGTNGLTASSFTQSAYYSSGYEAAAAFDGWSHGDRRSSNKKNLSGVANEVRGYSTWRENYRYSQWVQVDFGQIVEGINGVLLGTPPGYSWSPNAMMRSVQIQVSDNGSSWTTVVTFRNHVRRRDHPELRSGGRPLRADFWQSTTTATVRT